MRISIISVILELGSAAKEGKHSEIRESCRRAWKLEVNGGSELPRDEISTECYLVGTSVATLSVEPS